ncbi:MAG: GerMN domain-containing protein [Acidimicrobiales bacterium]
MTRHGTTRALAALAVLVVVALGACGVPVDEEPRPIARTTIPPTSTAPTTLPEDAGQEVAVYFLRGDRLERQGYTVKGEATLAQALGRVLEPPPEGSEDLQTAVPPGTSLLGVEVADRTATIDLTSEIGDVSALAQKQAFAQLVFTALAFPSLESVRFEVDGKPIDAPTDDGNRAEVTADNFDPPLNPR